MRDGSSIPRRYGPPIGLAVVGVLVGAGLAFGLEDYAVYLAISAVVSSVALLGLGVVTGSAGMIALCQTTFGAIGAYVVCALNVAKAPGGYLAWLVLGAVAAGLSGVVIGLPALRLRGVNLAVVTLGFAAAADYMLLQTQFPGAVKGVPVTRPDFAGDDRAFLVLAVGVLVVGGLLVHALQRSHWGTGWKAMAFSERGTAAVGARVPVAKLSAFAVSAALGGISGGLLAGQVQLPYESSFTPVQSLALYVLAIMSGAHLIDMAIFGGVLWVLVPEVLKRLGVAQDWGYVVFGLLGIQALASGNNLGSAIREAWWRRRHPRAGTQPDRWSSGPLTATPQAAAEDLAAPILTVENLSVEYGLVKALHQVTLSVPDHGILGLIGPNGAGKSTFIDTITGFLPQHTGSVTLNGRPLDGMSPTSRARQGVRRTFQQDRVPPTLTVRAYLRFVARRAVPEREATDVLEFFDCPAPSTRLADVDVGTRRLVEVAAGVLARPKVLLLDEPAAGLSHEEHLELGRRIAQVPDRFGISVVLIEHDLDMVRACCPTIAVLDFGQVLACGPQAQVLADPAVLKAYMGEVEML